MTSEAGGAHAEHAGAYAEDGGASAESDGARAEDDGARAEDDGARAEDDGFSIDVLRHVAEVRAWTRRERRDGHRVGLVPTMGALHEGHLALIDVARRRADRVVVSVFVNPTQFGEGEDLDRYPRDLAGDVAKAAARGAAVVFAPGPEEVYRPGHVTYLDVEGLSETLEGSCRPGHFRGVATVVAKLFNMVEPDVAVFGRKDAQQAAVIRRLAVDFDFPVEVVIAPTVREPDGLALSSRNVYLSAAERERALGLSRGLAEACRRFEAGERDAARLAGAARAMIEKGAEVDYVAVVDPDTFAPLETAGEGAVVCTAARVGATRLIDNMVLGGDPGVAP
jgi:pantoate--beta-alanine ligase